MNLLGASLASTVCLPNAAIKSSSFRRKASLPMSVKLSKSSHVSSSTAGKSGSRSMESTCFARGKSATVSVPMPGPTSSTLSSSHTSESLQMFAITASFTRKFCPSECFVAKPWRESTSRVAPTDAKCDAIAIEFPFLCPHCFYWHVCASRLTEPCAPTDFELPKAGTPHKSCPWATNQTFLSAIPPLAGPSQCGRPLLQRANPRPRMTSARNFPERQTHRDRRPSLSRTT